MYPKPSKCHSGGRLSVDGRMYRCWTWSWRLIYLLIFFCYRLRIARRLFHKNPPSRTKATKPLGKGYSQNLLGEGIFSENPLSQKEHVSSSLWGSCIIKTFGGRNILLFYKKRISLPQWFSWPLRGRGIFMNQPPGRSQNGPASLNAKKKSAW